MTWVFIPIVLPPCLKTHTTISHIINTNNIWQEFLPSELNGNSTLYNRGCVLNLSPCISLYTFIFMFWSSRSTADKVFYKKVTCILRLRGEPGHSASGRCCVCYLLRWKKSIFRALLFYSGLWFLSGTF